MFNGATELLKAAQKIVTLERSSGFQPLIIFTVIQSVIAIVLFWFFPAFSWLAALLIGINAVVFLVVYVIKAFSDSTFCRSERHVEALKRIEVERGDSGGSTYETGMLPSTEPPPALGGPQ